MKELKIMLPEGFFNDIKVETNVLNNRQTLQVEFDNKKFILSVEYSDRVYAAIGTIAEDYVDEMVLNMLSKVNIENNNENYNAKFKKGS